MVLRGAAFTNDWQYLITKTNLLCIKYKNIWTIKWTFIWTEQLVML